jgi:Mg-chelatase subunit ChlD
MNPETPRTPREEQEIRLVALLLGELPPEEAAALRHQLAEDPELQRFHEELERTLPLVREAAEPPSSTGTSSQAPLRLAESRRETLLGQFRTVPLPQPLAAPGRLQDRGWILLMSLAACLTALLGLLVLGPESSVARSRGNTESVSQFSSYIAPVSRGDLPALKQLDASGPAPRSITPETLELRLADDFVAVTGQGGAKASQPVPPPMVSVQVLPLPVAASAAGAPAEFSSVNDGVERLNRQLGERKDAEFKKEKADPHLGQGAGVPEAAGNTLARGRLLLSSQEGRAVPAGSVPPPAPASVLAVQEAAEARSLSPTPSVRGYGRPQDPKPTAAGKPASVPASGGRGLSEPRGEAREKSSEIGRKLVRAARTEAADAPAVSVTDVAGVALHEARSDGKAGDLVLGESPTLGAAFMPKQEAGFGGGGAGVDAGGVQVARGGEANAPTSLGFLEERGAPPTEYFFDRSGGGVERFGRELSQELREQVKEAYTFEAVNGVSSLAVARPEAQRQWFTAESARRATNAVEREIVRKGAAVSSLADLDAVSGRSAAEAPVLAKRYSLQILQRDAAKPLAAAPTPAAPVPPPREDDLSLQRRAAAPVPQPEIATAEQAFSTFSLNVSDVSFKLAEASLQKGALPDPGTLRTEEFLNALDYRDPEPPAGLPIAFQWEQSRYPFAHNRDLLRFSIKTAARGREPGRPLNLVLLIDNSGSMERSDRVGIIRECLRVLAAQLGAQDKLSVITFSRTARLRADGVSGAEAAREVDKVTGLTPEGGTNLEEALGLAYATARRHFLSGGVNRVVLLTDGAANLGNVDPESLKRMVEAHRGQGIALDSFGIGWEGYADDLLEVLTRNGDGRYGFINTAEEAASGFAGQLAGALQVAASDVKVQVEFNPRRVTLYRQLGYAKHQLKKEQFRDNTVDAAEIGAAESGNALYLVQVNPRGEGDIAWVRVRFKVPGTSDYREHEYAVPYRGQASPLSEAPASLRLAAAAGAFAEWLVGSPFAGEVTPDALLGLLRGAPEPFGPDSRPQRLEWMIRQAKSLSGK